MIDEGLEAFASQLQEEVEAGRLSDGGEPYSEHEFTKQMLEKLAEDGIVENPVLVPQGDVRFRRQRCRISGYALSEDEDRLLLVTTVYTGELPPKKLTPDERMNAIKQALHFYDNSRRGLHEHIEPSNTDASDIARKIFEADKDIEVLRMIVLSDAITGMDQIDLRTGAGVRVIVDLYGIERLYRIIGQGLTRDDIGIDFARDYGGGLPCLSVPDASDRSYSAFLAVIPGAVLADIYERYGTRLLELNVRAFLGLRGRTSVNAGLRKTIRDAPTDFLAFNNGIVATIDKVEVSRDDGPTRIMRLQGLQIVNGGQTTASLHRSRRLDRTKLEGILVPAKIIITGDGEVDTMVREISRCANAQNTVQAADFSANDPFHRRIETLAHDVYLQDGSGRWFYERARGAYEASLFKSASSKEAKRTFERETPKKRRFSKTDVARYLNGWDGHPDLVSFGNQKNFSAFMQQRKTSEVGIDDLDQDWYRRFIGKAILFRSIQKLVKACAFPAYQANITAYTFSVLANRLAHRIDLVAIWNRQDISSELADIVMEWAVIVERELRSSAGSRMPSEWAKKEACWLHMKENVQFPRAGAAPDLMVVGSGSRT